MLSSSSQIIPPHCQWIRLQQTEAHPFTFTPTHQPAPIPSNYLGPLGASSSNIPSLGVLFFRLPTTARDSTSTDSSKGRQPLHDIPSLPQPSPRPIERTIESKSRLFFSVPDNRCTTPLASPSLHLDRSNEQSSRRVGFFFGSGLDADHSPSFLSSADNRCTTPLASPSLHLDRSNKQSSRRPFFRSPLASPSQHLGRSIQIKSFFRPPPPTIEPRLASTLTYRSNTPRVEGLEFFWAAPVLTENPILLPRPTHFAHVFPPKRTVPHSSTQPPSPTTRLPPPSPPRSISAFFLSGCRQPARDDEPPPPSSHSSLALDRLIEIGSKAFHLAANWASPASFSGEIDADDLFLFLSRRPARDKDQAFVFGLV
ncbi:hypothetical protein PGT21_017027, partial [Puccinia graminis f. sp. tritici]